MTKRRGVSPSTRFRVFKRDSFTCIYCGRKPPDIELELDHIEPIATGGSNKIGNLTTSCKTCNRGKAAEPLEVAPASLEAQAAEAQDNASRLAVHLDAASALNMQEDAAIEFISAPYRERYGEELYVRDFESIRANFLHRLTIAELREFMQVACARMNNERHAFRYFCGCCWRRIRGEGPGQ